MSESNRLTEYLTDNPRMIGVLFTLVLLLSQAGTVVAGNNIVIDGP